MWPERPQWACRKLGTAFRERRRPSASRATSPRRVLKRSAVACCAAASAVGLTQTCFDFLAIALEIAFATASGAKETRSAAAALPEATGRELTDVNRDRRPGGSGGVCSLIWGCLLSIHVFACICVYLS